MDQPRNIMLDTEGINPRIHLSEVVPASLTAAQFWVEVLDPLPLSAPRSHKAYCRVKDLFVVMGQFSKIGLVRLLAESFCQLGNTPIVVAIFKCYRHRLPTLRCHFRHSFRLSGGQGWEKTLLKINPIQAGECTSSPRKHCCHCRVFSHGLIGLFYVEIAVSLLISIQNES